MSARQAAQARHRAYIGVIAQRGRKLGDQSLCCLRNHLPVEFVGRVQPGAAGATNVLLALDNLRERRRQGAGGSEQVDLEAHPAPFSGLVEHVLQRRVGDQATPYQTGSSRDSTGRTAAGVAQCSVRRKRLEDIQLELERPFEHQGRLVDLLARQRESLKRHDLDKDEAGSARLDADEMKSAA